MRRYGVKGLAHVAKHEFSKKKSVVFPCYGRQKDQKKNSTGEPPGGALTPATGDRLDRLGWENKRDSINSLIFSLPDGRGGHLCRAPIYFCPTPAPPRPTTRNPATRRPAARSPPARRAPTRRPAQHKNPAREIGPRAAPDSQRHHASVLPLQPPIHVGRCPRVARSSCAGSRHAHSQQRG